MTDHLGQREAICGCNPPSYYCSAHEREYQNWIGRRALAARLPSAPAPDQSLGRSEMWPNRETLAVREDGSKFPVLHSPLCPCSRSRAGWAWCEPACVAYKYRAAALAAGEGQDA